MNPRLANLLDHEMASARESAGMHRYDGQVADLSPSGVRSFVSRLGQGPVEPDRHDEAHLQAMESGARVYWEELAEHRRNPLVHLENLDLATYDRDYAPEAERHEARRRHLACWPDAIDAAIESLDRVPAPIATSLLGPAAGLAAELVPDDGDAVVANALAAHARLMEHLGQASEHGPPEVGIGAASLARLMGESEAMMVDLGRLAATARSETERLGEILAEACKALSPDSTPARLVPELLRDHPSSEDIYTQAQSQINEATAFMLARNLLADPGGKCVVGPAPPSRRWAMAMMSWSGPYEVDTDSWYQVNPPDPTWSPEEQEEWLSVFSHTTLPVITVHEVTPGHFAHGRMLRQVRGDVRRCLYSSSFVEGWAHYAEELYWEEGFRADDGRFAIGMCIEALVRVTRLSVALGLHTGAMSQAEAVRLFEIKAFLSGPAARSEAERGAFDPTYGRYTWGKLEIMALRDEARAQWGQRYNHRRFHEALLSLGAPPLGLMGAALDTPRR